MRIVSTVDEGKAITEHLKTFDKVSVDGTFGRLSFEIDTASLTVQECNDLLDELWAIDDIITSYAENGHIEFDYYVTSDLLPDIRAAIDKYCQPNSRGILLYWIYD